MTKKKIINNNYKNNNLLFNKNILHIYFVHIFLNMYNNIFNKICTNIKYVQNLNIQNIFFF